VVPLRGQPHTANICRFMWPGRAPQAGTSFQ
jgi:hypothetical protein